MRFWMSWFQPGEDYRPLTFPPSAPILGWWCSGHSEDAASIVALVEAADEAKARAAVAAEWPESATAEWRFCEVVGGDFVLSDRFPPSDWMRERINAARRGGG